MLGAQLLEQTLLPDHNPPNGTRADGMTARLLGAPYPSGAIGVADNYDPYRNAGSLPIGQVADRARMLSQNLVAQTMQAGPLGQRGPGGWSAADVPAGYGAAPSGSPPGFGAAASNTPLAFGGAASSRAPPPDQTNSAQPLTHKDMLRKIRRQIHLEFGREIHYLKLLVDGMERLWLECAGDDVHELPMLLSDGGDDMLADWALLEVAPNPESPFMAATGAQQPGWSAGSQPQDARLQMGTMQAPRSAGGVAASGYPAQSGTFPAPSSAQMSQQQSEQQPPLQPQQPREPPYFQQPLQALLTQELLQQLQPQQQLQQLLMQEQLLKQQLQQQQQQEQQWQQPLPMQRRHRVSEYDTERLREMDASATFDQDGVRVLGGSDVTAVRDTAMELAGQLIAAAGVQFTGKASAPNPSNASTTPGSNDSSVGSYENLGTRASRTEAIQASLPPGFQRAGGHSELAHGDQGFRRNQKGRNHGF